MSLFGSMMRDFDHDPFFNGQMENMRRMENMMSNMMSPFETMLGGPSPMMGNSLMPFGFGRSLFPNMNNLGLMTNFNSFGQNPSYSGNSHSYSSSSVMSFTTDEHGQPQVYQSSSSMRTAPGGVKETRKTYQDTRSGLQSMAIGHHLGERAHIIEKAKNRFTGEENENQDFINLEEEEAPAFNEEWQNKAQAYASRPQQLGQSQNYSPQQTTQSLPAITAGPSHSERQKSRKRESPVMTVDGQKMEAKQKKRHFLHKMKGGHEKSKHPKNRHEPKV